MRELPSRWGREDGSELQSLDSVPNTHELNRKSLRKRYVVKTYILLIEFRPSDEDVRLGGPLGDFR
jgi:hypothetical protein